MVKTRANEKKRYAQGFSAFDTAETAADSKDGVQPLKYLKPIFQGQVNN
jgi:hypothetical protein